MKIRMEKSKIQQTKKTEFKLTPDDQETKDLKNKIRKIMTDFVVENKSMSAEKKAELLALYKKEDFSLSLYDLELLSEKLYRIDQFVGLFNSAKSDDDKTTTLSAYVGYIQKKEKLSNELMGYYLGKAYNELNDRMERTNSTVGHASRDRLACLQGETEACDRIRSIQDVQSMEYNMRFEKDDKIPSKKLQTELEIEAIVKKVMGATIPPDIFNKLKFGSGVRMSDFIRAF